MTEIFGRRKVQPDVPEGPLFRNFLIFPLKYGTGLVNFLAAVVV